MEHCNFQQAKQAPSESIADVVEKFKELALHCNFASLNDAMSDRVSMWRN